MVAVGSNECVFSLGIAVSLILRRTVEATSFCNTKHLLHRPIPHPHISFLDLDPHGATRTSSGRYTMTFPTRLSIQAQRMVCSRDGLSLPCRTDW